MQLILYIHCILSLDHVFGRLQLKQGLFWTDIIPNCTKWSITGLLGLILRRFGAKLRCASFLTRKNDKKSQYGPKKHKNVDFREKKSLRSYMPNPKVGKIKN